MDKVDVVSGSPTIASTVKDFRTAGKVVVNIDDREGLFKNGEWRIVVGAYDVQQMPAVLLFTDDRCT